MTRQEVVDVLHRLMVNEEYITDEIIDLCIKENCSGTLDVLRVMEDIYGSDM